MARRNGKQTRRPLVPESISDLLARHPELMEALTARTVERSPFSDLLHRFGDPHRLLPFIADVEIEFKPASQELVFDDSFPTLRYTVYSREPTPPRFEQLEPIADHSPRRGYRGRGLRLFSFTLDFGDHRETWYVKIEAFDRIAVGNYEETQAACIALTVVAREHIRALLDEETAGDRPSDVRHLLPNLTWGGRRARAREDYETFVALGDLPRGRYARSVPVTPDFAEDENALSAMGARMMSLRETESFDRLMYGDWSAGVDYAAEEGAGQTVITNAEGERVVQQNRLPVVYGRHTVSIGFRDPSDNYLQSPRAVNENGMWFDQYTINRQIDTRAEGLLLAHLTEAQREEYVLHKRITLEAKSGRRYVVHRARTYNVEQLSDEGRPVLKLCVVTDTPTSLPIADVMLMQMVLIRNDEEGFLRTANRSYVGGQRRIPLDRFPLYE